MKAVPESELPETGSWPGEVHGQLGALEYTAEGLVRCHICGGAFASLGVHTKGHGITAPAYKAYFGLNRRQSLLAPHLKAELQRRSSSPAYVERLKASMLVGPDRSLARGGKKATYRLQGLITVQSRKPTARPGPRPDRRKVRLCETCGNPVEWHPGNYRRFCSDACRRQVTTQKRGPVKTPPCSYCGRPILRRRPTRGIPRTCSPECAAAKVRQATAAVPRDCRVCGKPVLRRLPSGKIPRTCSVECAAKGRGPRRASLPSGDPASGGTGYLFC